jgi:glycosyltransferase involved in cell wall biosynthesis
MFNIMLRLDDEKRKLLANIREGFGKKESFSRELKTIREKIENNIRKKQYLEHKYRIGKEKAKKCVLLLHTQVRDDNGTDLSVVRDLLCDPEYVKVVFHDARIPSNEVNWLYNIADVTALISSNEGWGLSLTESLMTGKMIIANVTGGMQDQMRFEDEDGNWIDFDENFCSNHFGTYKKHGEWAVPVFPTNSSIVGSIPTPYIFDDRCDFRDVAKAIKAVYDLDPQERAKKGNAGREWVLSQEAKMSAETMCQNVVECIDQTFETFEPRKSFELTKIEKLPRKKIVHKLTY